MKKIKEHKGYVIAENPKIDDVNSYPYYVYTKEEWSFGEGCRYYEFECESIQECLDNLESED